MRFTATPGPDAADQTIARPIHSSPDSLSPASGQILDGSAWQKRVSLIWGDMRLRIGQHQTARVEDYLSDEFSDCDPEVLLDLIYGEYALRGEAGETPLFSEYAARFPQFERQLRRQFAVHDAVEDGVTLSGNSTPFSQSRSQTTSGSGPLTIGKYRVISRLGAGGQATVYRAVHPTLGTDVVIKLGRHPIDPAAANQTGILAEGRILAGLRHPNLVSIYDLDFEEGCPFLVMEYAPGRSLDRVVSDMRIAPVEAARWVATIARAAAVAHQKGVIHRDIKPQNILLTHSGEPRLLDFGFAATSSVWSPAEVEREVCGTLRYMAPEQAGVGAGGMSRQTDVFGLGAVLYYLLTGGRPLYAGGNALELLTRARAADWDRAPLESLPVSPKLIAICKKALSADPRDRYSSADELADALERVLQPTRRGVLIASGVLLGLLTVSAAMAVWMGRGSRDLPDKSSDTPRTPAASESTGPSLKPDQSSLPAVALPLPQLHVKVWNEDDERYQDLLYCLPLGTGEKLRVEADCPAGWHVKLYWISGDGELQDLGERLGGSTRSDLSYPSAADEAAPLIGKPQTEVVILHGWRQGSSPRLSIKSHTQWSPAWPMLPPTSMVRLTPEGITVGQQSRSLGHPVKQVDPEQQVIERLTPLRANLEHHEFVTAIAFSHP